MSKISKGRRVGQAAVNALRTLLEDHGHIVQEISGQNDFGEDFYVRFTDSDGQVTSDEIKVQVKGGDRRRRGNGFAVPVDQHSDTWANGNIPVYAVVYDPDTKRLYWANATQQLRKSGHLNPPCFIGVSPNSVLDGTTMESFVAEARRYVGRYRDRQAVLTHLGEMSGVEFEPEDHVLHFVNGEDEDLIFWKRPGNAVATLLLSTQGWEPVDVSLESLTRSVLPVPENSTGSELADPDLWTAEDLDLSRYEIMWATACFLSTWEADEGAGLNECEGCPSCTGEEHGEIEADLLHEYILARILDRIEAEPDLMQRSILAMREDRDLAPTIIAELGPLESEPRIVRKVNKLSRTTVSTVDDIEPEVFRLAILYLIRKALIYGPSVPVDERVEIVWRIPELESAASNH
ncbi:DUF4365 domain-containing protein [Nocardia sp. CA-129566]|uniref:DUF4365 domain-containing protein n=1 Tax=Nocardia sp. CA-129566 TaxID=3239976 RepID=UPI003D9A070F